MQCSCNSIEHDRYPPQHYPISSQGILELSSVVMSTCRQRLMWLCKWSNKKACEKRNTYSKINVQKWWCIVSFPRFISLSQFFVTVFLPFFIPGKKDIVLELLSTMTKARDIAFVDKVRNYFNKLLEESENKSLCEWGAWLVQWSRPIFVNRWNNSVCLYLFTFSNWYTHFVLAYILLCSFRPQLNSRSWWICSSLQ